MAILKCKMCGGDLNVAEGISVCECEYCGTKQTVATTKDEGLNGLYNRANMLRMKCDFDKAESLYEKILQSDIEQAEAYWGLILCKYGIEYVEDPKTFKRIPTCHRTSIESVTADEDYKAALQYADPMQTSLYEAEAKEIDRLQKEILALSKNEEPYDVFICYKETDEQGKRTKDSVIANDIYYQLTQEGFKVFYAAITLEDKLGSAYEPCIFSALNSAKVMLVIGTKPEYFNAVWVKNEWSRFLKMMKADRSKTLFPCYRDMDAYDLPEEFAHLQAQDMSKIGFINDVVRGIKKLVVKEVAPAPAPVVAAPVAAPVAAAPAGGNAATLVSRGNLMLEDGEWDKADDFFEKALNQDAQCAEAYVGKFLAQMHQKTMDAWVASYLRETEPAQKQANSMCVQEQKQFVARMVKEYEIPYFLPKDSIMATCDWNKDYYSIQPARQEQLQKAEQIFVQNAQLSKAYRFAQGEVADRLNRAKAKLVDAMTQRITDAEEKAASEKEQVRRQFDEHCEAVRRKLDQKRATAEDEQERMYRSACDRMDSTETSGYLLAVYNDFGKLDDYKDSRTKREECKRMLNAAKAREEDARLAAEEKYREQREKELAEEEARRAKESRKNKIKRFFKNLIVLAVVAAIGYFVVYKLLIYPLMPNKNLYTPEIVTSYNGTYKNGTTSGEATVTFTSCDKSGNLTGTFEFIVTEDEKQIYGQYEITGKITSKKNNDNLKLTITAGEWLVQPEGFEPLGEMAVTISKEYTKFKCDEYSIDWSTGSNDENKIESADDLKKLSGSTDIYRLTKDIDLSGMEWSPIEGFAGTLLGNGHTIKGLTINADADNVGFFSTLNGTVQNLKFEDASITVTGRHENIGILCGKMEGGIIINVETSGTVTAETGTNVGGIAGQVATIGSYSMANLKNNATVTGLDKAGGVFGALNNVCNSWTDHTVTLSGLENTAAITAVNQYVGGIVGYLTQSSRDSDTCTLNASLLKNTGAVEGDSYVGGLFGYAETDTSDSYIQDCANNSSVSGKYYVGCMGGMMKYIVINDCANKGSTLTATGQVTVDGVKCAYVGGFVGYGYLANNCTNEVTIDYTGSGCYVGGIIGYLDAKGTYSMSGLVNNASVSGYSYVGGIFGAVDNAGNGWTDHTVTLSGLENTAAITAVNQYVGGIVGYLTQSSRDSDTCTLNASLLKNTGAVEGDSYVGGLFGYAETDSSDSFIQDCTNNSSVSGKYYVGCMGGVMKYIVINDCANKGSTLTATGYTTVDGVKYAYVGGYAGYGYLANNCTNEVTINYTGSGRYVAGIIGYIDAKGTYSMSGLVNNASVSGYSYVGGIFGASNNADNGWTDHTVTLSYFENTATIKAKTEYVGGIAGYLKQASRDSDTCTLIASDFKNTGSVSGSSYVGGLFGYAETDSDKSALIDSSTSKGKIAGKLVNIKQE